MEIDQSILRHKDFESIFKIVKAEATPLLIGPSGCGKTTISRQVATKMDLPFYYTGAVNSAFQLRGFVDAYGHVVKTPFREAYENGGIFLFDELDASCPAAIVSLHSALDNGVMDAPEGIIKKHPDFHYIGAANTFGRGATLDNIGRNALDGATLDRYVFYPMGYDHDLETRIVAEKYPDQGAWVYTVQKARQAARELMIPQIISTRACRDGAALLEQGFDPLDVFKMTVAKGLTVDDALKIWHAIGKISDEQMKKALQESNKSFGDLDDPKNLIALFVGAKKVQSELKKTTDDLNGIIKQCESISPLRLAIAKKILGISLRHGD